MPQAMSSAAELEIGVGKHDVRTLAAAFERYALHVRFAGVAQHELADFRRTGEGDHVDIAMQRERLSGLLAEAGNDVENAGGQARLAGELGNADGGQRRLLGGLEHDGVAA